MQRWLCLFLLGAVLCTVLAAPKQRQERSSRQHLVRGRPREGLTLKPRKPENYVPSRTVKSGQYTQLLDHFSSNDTRTWKQRWWSNDQYYKPGGAVFFMLGGESEEDPYWLEDGTLFWTTEAQAHNAYLFLAEHRYYGSSHPTTSMSVANLQWLTAPQAIEDYAALIVYWKQQNPQLANASWVSFGGSYSGALSAWLRKKHPELIAAAVASSGPVQAEADFIEYLEVVRDSIATYSTACAASVQAGFAAVQALVATAAGRNTIQNTFELCSAIKYNSSKDLAYFWEGLYGNYMGVVQYSGVSSLTIGNAICRFHDNNSTAVLARMQQANSYILEQNGESCLYIDYTGMVQAFKETNWGDYADDRAWIWQTCTEFGYYQTTDSPTAGPFWGNNTNLDYYTQQCIDIYGSIYTTPYVLAAVQQTNQYFGGRDNLGSSKIILPDGTIDPWHALGKLTSNDSTVVPVIITGTAHCADMYGPDSSDPASLTQARQQIRTLLSQFLGN